MCVCVCVCVNVRARARSIIFLSLPFGFCLHGPLAVASTPAHLATHAFEYVLPSLPHTGFIILVHAHALGVVALGEVALGLAAVVALIGPVAVVVDMTFSFLCCVRFRTNTQAHALCTRRLDGGFVCTNVLKKISEL